MQKGLIKIGDIESGFSFWGFTEMSTGERVNAEIDAFIEAGVIELDFEISSYGGVVYEAQAIADKIKLVRSKGIKTVGIILGKCMSAGTVIACAMDKVIMGAGATYMIHQAWNFAEGNKKDMSDTAYVLGQVDKSIAEVYSQKTGMTTAECMKMMEAHGRNGTFMTAKEAKKYGFVDEILDEKFIEKQKAVIMASFNPYITMNTNDLITKFKNTMSKVFGNAKNAYEGKIGESTAIVIGAPYDSESPDDLVGRLVLLVNETEETNEWAPDGEHTLDNGWMITVANKRVESASTGETEAMEDEEETEAEESKAKIEAMEKEKEEMKAKMEAQAKEVSELKATLSEFMAKLSDPKAGAQLPKQQNQVQIEKPKKGTIADARAKVKPLQPIQIKK